MSEISVLDLQNLRHLIGGYETSCQKMTEYANMAQDAEVKKLFQDAADPLWRDDPPDGKQRTETVFKTDA